MENLEQRYELKNLSVRQGQNGKLYISIYQGYDQESGYHTENILSNGHEIIYKFEASVNGTNYDYENARDYDDYGIVYNFATTYNRLVGGSVLDKKDFSKKELFKLDCLFNEKLKGLFSDAYVVKQHKNADYKFLKEGDIVFCQSLTFAATANPVTYEKATPVFIDSEIGTWNMSPVALQKAFDKYEKLGKLPKAVMVVHLDGICAHIEEIVQICKKYTKQGMILSVFFTPWFLW